MKNNSSDLHEGTNVETHGVRLNVETHGVRLKRNVLPGLLRGMGRKRETKHGWNSPLTHSASKKELTKELAVNSFRGEPQCSEAAHNIKGKKSFFVGKRLFEGAGSLSEGIASGLYMYPCNPCSSLDFFTSDSLRGSD
jgi:hypothetical protein